MLNKFEGKSVLVTGATGLIGRQLIDLLLERKAKITAVSLDKLNESENIRYKDIKFVIGDLRDFNVCIKLTESCDIVFHLAGIKGSPLLTKKQPSTFFVNTMMFNINMIEAARRNKVKNFLYTSTVGVYAPATKFYEESVWQTMPSKNDWFAGWAKRMGELQIESARIEFQWEGTHIIRPSNVYGPWDNFDLATSMVIPSLIVRIANGENPLKVWGDGSAVRDFIHAKDVARAMMFVVENNISEPVNIGCGVGTSILDLTKLLQEIKPGLSIEWEASMPKGDDSRVMDMTKLQNHGFELSVPLNEGLEQTYKWYLSNKDSIGGRYNAFEEKN
jgi:GDP-L-fucose synthase